MMHDLRTSNLELCEEYINWAWAGTAGGAADAIGEQQLKWTQSGSSS